MPELIVTLEDTASANILRKAIELLKGVKKVSIKKDAPLSIIKASQLKELEKMEQLEQNWDGDAAVPIRRRAIKNMRGIILKSDDDVLSHWAIFPETNGTLLFQKDDYSACLSVGERDYTLISPILNKNHEAISINTISKELRQI